MFPIVKIESTFFNSEFESSEFEFNSYFLIVFFLMVKIDRTFSTVNLKVVNLNLLATYNSNFL